MIACTVSFGYPTGRWAVAQRRPVDEVAGGNGWDGELGFSVPEPLWSLSEPSGVIADRCTGGDPSGPSSPPSLTGHPAVL